MNTHPANAHETLALWILNARKTIAFTGAGMSTESGIPDFRSPGGIWSQSQPVLYDEFLRSAEARHEYWRQKPIAHGAFASARPNVGHQVLAKWEAEGRLHGVITQNIDGLHEDGGSKAVLELHGTARRIACLDCGNRYDPDPLVDGFLTTGEVPLCPKCGGLLKHATVSFGQALPEDVLTDAMQWSSECDLFLAMGSSLVVEPAASLPRRAVDTGARLVIVNRDATDQDRSAALVFHASIGKTLSAVDEAIHTTG